ncbi:sensor histidine kinase [Paenibacillus sp. GCM10027626]|uniref:sensor histidine kinase n=1 Tax=Paenibacillus sp. GCM10027626 TaxID=3273411 RepID=UPI0036376E0F
MADSVRTGKLLSFGLFHKILISFLVAIIPIMVVGYVLVSNGENIIRKEIESSLHSRVHFYLTELARELGHITSLKREYIFDEEIQRLNVLSPAMDDYDRRVAVLNLQKKMQTLSSSSSYIKTVKLHMPAEQKVIQPDQILYGSSDRDKEKDIQLHAMLNRSEFPIVSWNKQLVMVERYPTGNYMNGELPLYWIEIVLDRSKIVSALSNILTENGGNAILTGSAEKWAVLGDDSDPAFTEELTRLNRMEGDASDSGQRRITVWNQVYMVAYERALDLGLALTLYIPEKVVLEPLEIYKVWFRILVATAMLIIVLFAYWIYLFLQRPLQRLIRAFRKVKEGTFDVHLIHKNKDEIQYLYQQFNQMVDTIQSLIRDVYEQNIRWQRAELRHLQTQINPHFLYNTYYRMHRLVQAEDTDSLKRYTRLLGDYLKYIARNVQEEATLRMEVDHARTYAEILKMRFRDKIEIEWADLPDCLAELKVPRLILQPIVENAFEYGVEEVEGIGLLRFSVTMGEQSLTMIVEDNGGQLSDAGLRDIVMRLASREDDMETTGLINVHRRLRLKYGEDYGIQAERSELGGLRIIINIPLGEDE